MSAETIQELLKRGPFEPFEVRLSNGDIHQIRHAECAVLTKSRMVIVYPDQDRIAICALLHVARVEMMQPVAG